MLLHLQPLKRLSKIFFPQRYALAFREPMSEHPRLRSLKMKKRFNVVVASDGGVPQLRPMKQWVKQHPEQGLTEPMTSHQMRNRLKDRRWIVRELDDQVLLIQPDSEAALKLADEFSPEPSDDPVEETEEDFLFPLESHLRDFIAENIGSLPALGQGLALHKDERGSGVEYPTDVGFIDILVRRGQREFVVFELKLARSPDKAVGQIARYMGWVTKHLAKGLPVNGIIVANSVDEKLKYAASVIPNVSLFEYSLSFALNPVGIQTQ
jgi:hypothetical protein